jgi:hypothetical protein
MAPSICTSIAQPVGRREDFGPLSRSRSVWSAPHPGAFISSVRDIVGPREHTAPGCGSRTTQGTDTSVSALQTLREVRLRSASAEPIFFSMLFDEFRNRLHHIINHLRR